MEITFNEVSIELPLEVVAYLQSLSDLSGDSILEIILDRLSAGMDEATEAA